jgi:PAS domain S-box-containing protein
MPRSREFDALTPWASVDSAISTRDRAALLREGISDALVANLRRGFLESEERFRQIVEGLHDVIWLTNPSGTQLYFVNAAYEQIWGLSRDAMYANPMAYMDSVHPDDQDRVRRTIGTHPGTHDIEFRIVRPSGDIRCVWSRGYPVFDADGEIYRIGNIIEDITERRQIVQSHERLVRGFTHDIKNPLGAADGYLALLEMGIYGPMSAPQTESVGRARATIRTALTLIMQLLDIERAQSGQLAIHWQLTDVDAIAKEIVQGFRGAANARRLQLELLPHRADDSLVLESDPALVRQIIANLVSNAVKYTQPDGHVAVRVRVADETGVPPPGRWLGVEVADDGPGIPLAKQRMLFREFARFDPNAAEGSGIGLAISQRLAGMLGAVITFTSTPGEGSNFTLWLPLDPPVTPA